MLEEELINFECVTTPTGDATMEFENGLEMFVSDLTAYYGISEKWLPIDENWKEGVHTYKGAMPREVYAGLCAEYLEQMSS